MSKKVLVLGSSGMAGHVITSGLSADPSFQVISLARSKSNIYTSILMDVTDFNTLREFISTSSFDVIINCVGLLNKNAEDNPDQAIMLNSYLPHFLESVTKDTKSKIIHISTDCVFSGKEGAYTEKSFKNGIGYYAQSKALGELVNSKDLTFRTSIIGPELNTNGIGLFHWFFMQEGTIYGYKNAFWTGVTTIELMNAIKVAINEDLTGLYHLVNDVKISKFDLLNLFNNIFNKGLNILPYNDYSIDKSLINSRMDFSFKVNNYEVMIVNMKEWIYSNINLYPHYKDLY